MTTQNAELILFNDWYEIIDLVTQSVDSPHIANVPTAVP